MAATDHPICRICKFAHALLDGHIWPKEGEAVPKAIPERPRESGEDRKAIPVVVTAGETAIKKNPRQPRAKSAPQPKLPHGMVMVTNLDIKDDGSVVRTNFPPEAAAAPSTPISEDKAAKRREQVRLNVAACRARKKEKQGATA